MPGKSPIHHRCCRRSCVGRSGRPRPYARSLWWPLLWPLLWLDDLGRLYSSLDECAAIESSRVRFSTQKLRASEIARAARVVPQSGMREDQMNPQVFESYPRRHP